jgi:hypothetical protein
MEEVPNQKIMGSFSAFLRSWQMIVFLHIAGLALVSANQEVTCMKDTMDQWMDG